MMRSFTYVPKQKIDYYIFLIENCEQEINSLFPDDVITISGSTIYNNKKILCRSCDSIMDIDEKYQNGPFSIQCNKCNGILSNLDIYSNKHNTIYTEFFVDSLVEILEIIFNENIHKGVRKD